MKLTFTILLLLIVGISSCNFKNTKESSIFENKFLSINEISTLKEYTFLGGGLVGHPNPYDKSEREFSLDILTKDSSAIILFVRNLEDSVYTFQLVDTVVIVNYNVKHEICIQICGAESETDPEIIALVEPDSTESEFHTKVIRAWRANRKEQQIVEIDPSNISCYNYGYGL